MLRKLAITLPIDHETNVNPFQDSFPAYNASSVSDNQYPVSIPPYYSQSGEKDSLTDSIYVKHYTLAGNDERSR